MDQLWGALGLTWNDDGFVEDLSRKALLSGLWHWPVEVK